MKIALLFHDEKLKALRVDALSVLIVEMGGDTIENVENHSLYSRDLNYISLWLVIRHIDVIYLHSADGDIRDFFKRINVEVRTFEDLKENPLLSLSLL